MDDSNQKMIRIEYEDGSVVYDAVSSTGAFVLKSIIEGAVVKSRKEITLAEAREEMKLKREGA